MLRSKLEVRLVRGAEGSGAIRVHTACMTKATGSATATGACASKQSWQCGSSVEEEVWKWTPAAVVNTASSSTHASAAMARHETGDLWVVRNAIQSLYY